MSNSREEVLDKLYEGLIHKNPELTTNTILFFVDENHIIEFMEIDISSHDRPIVEDWVKDMEGKLQEPSLAPGYYRARIYFVDTTYGTDIDTNQCLLKN